MTDPSQYLKIDEAARLLGVSRRWVYRRIWSGELPANKVGGLYFIPRQALQSLLAGGRTLADDAEPTAPVSARLKCGACYRLLLSDAQIGEVCQSEGCDELICCECLAEGIQHCAQHSPSREQKWEAAQQRYQQGELPLLLKSSTARLREVNFLNRIQMRLESIKTLFHPQTGEILTIPDWNALLEISDERAEIMRLQGKVILDTGMLASTPINSALTYRLPLQKNQKGLPLEVHVQVISRLANMLRDGFDTQPLSAELLQERILRLNEAAQHNGAFQLIVLASTTGWDAAARQILVGDGREKAFSHRQLLLYLFDLEHSELLYNPRDERLRLYAELFAPSLPAEELDAVIKMIEKEMLAYDSLTLRYAAETLPYPEAMLKRAFEQLAAGGNYSLTDVPNLGLTLVKK
ncbi:MAG: helix-turn-helix domain-containing protein [Anaerolineales bacterium]|nr:helix-turn-helix domain-containing protein [Anaerolineales bacterium]